MQPKTSQAHQSNPNDVTLAAPMLRDRLDRKIRRSKKLTKLLLRESVRLQLTSHTDALKQCGRLIATLTPESTIPEATSLACIGRTLTQVDRPKDLPHFPPTKVIRFENALAYGHSSLIQLPPGRLIHHDLFTPATHMISEEDHRRLRIDVADLTCQIIASPLLTRTLPQAALFTDSLASNYAHWLTEVLPRIALYARDECSKGFPLIVDAGLHPNIYESLSIVIGSERTFFKLPVNRRVLVQQLDVVTPAGYVPYSARAPKRQGHSHGIFSAEALWAVRDACKHLMSPARSSAGKRIYVRRNAGVRKLVNDQQISNILAAAGFIVIAPEELSFSEQVRLFSQAELVIGATGAAMANLIFCPPRSKVHVLMAQHEDMPYWYWQRLADCINIELTYGLGEICAAHDRGFHADFTVDIRHIEEVLRSEQPTARENAQRPESTPPVKAQKRYRTGPKSMTK